MQARASRSAEASTSAGRSVARRANCASFIDCERRPHAMPPAARLTDMHVCPMVTGIVPHVGGPIIAPGCPTVLIGFLPAARVTDMAVCVGPADMVAMGSTSVLIGFLPAARIGDMTVHGGLIVLGEFTVMIGG